MTGGHHPIPWGKPLSIEAKRQVDQLRARFAKYEIPPNYDTDFNLLRWILNVERTHKVKSPKDLIDQSEKALRNHVVYRKLLKLDDGSIPSWDKNPMFTSRTIPQGKLSDKPDRLNRIMWYIEYRSLKFEVIVNKLRTTEMALYQFWLYEIMLRRVNEQERLTGRLSSIHHVTDMAGMAISPFTMLFVSNGQMAYFAHLMHYEHYPELVSPTHMCNCPKWMTIPYRLIRGMMPSGFTDRFKLHDHKHTDGLLQEVDADNLPDYLGGENTELSSIPADPEYAEKFADQSHQDDENQATTAGANAENIMDEHRLAVTIHARRRKIIPVEVQKRNTRLFWHFNTDADVYFGVFKHPIPPNEKSIGGSGADNNDTTDSSGGGGGGDYTSAAALAKLEIDTLEMVYPWFKLGAKLVAEADNILCTEPGVYYLIFCNRHSWLQRRNVHLKVDLHTQPYRIERTLSL